MENFLIYAAIGFVVVLLTSSFILDRLEDVE